MRVFGGLLLILGVFVAGGCTGGSDQEAETRRPPSDVAADDGASASEVVTAGYPFDADEAEGVRLVLYRVMGETGDVEQTAWRLYGPDGETAAEGKGGTTVLGLPSGFFLGDFIVAADGTLVEPSRASDSLAPRPGDLVIDAFDEIQALRPDPPTVYAPAPSPRGLGQGWALDAEGRQWYQRVEPEEVLVAPGTHWQEVRPVVVQPGQRILGFGITPVGGFVVLPVVRSVGGERIAVDVVAVRRTDAAPSAPWDRMDGGPLRSSRREAFPHTFAADEEHYVFADLIGPPYVLDVRSGQWSRLSLPDGENGWTLEQGHDGLYAFPPTGDVKIDPHAWRSTDLGATWEELPH